MSEQPAERLGASARRQAIIDHANSIGINDDYISTLVDTFYARVREHAILGPIFNGAIEDWDYHLPRMKDFWASVTMNAGRYSGKPVPAHMKHAHRFDEKDFDVWLDLFGEVLGETAPSAEAAEYFMIRARRIAQSLRLAIYGLPQLRVE